MQTFSHCMVWKHFTLSAHMAMQWLDKFAVHLIINQSLPSVEILRQSDLYDKYDETTMASVFFILQLAVTRKHWIFIGLIWALHSHTGCRRTSKKPPCSLCYCTPKGQTCREGFPYFVFLHVSKWICNGAPERRQWKIVVVTQKFVCSNPGPTIVG